MRLAWRFNDKVEALYSIWMLSLLLTLCSCSMLPDVNIEKNKNNNRDGSLGFFQKVDAHNTPSASFSDHNTYLATVHVQFSDNAAPVNFDIHRDRSDLVSFNLQRTQETSTYLHLGYTHSEGGIAGLRFSWHF